MKTLIPAHELALSGNTADGDVLTGQAVRFDGGTAIPQRFSSPDWDQRVRPNCANFSATHPIVRTSCSKHIDLYSSSTKKRLNFENSRLRQLFLSTSKRKSTVGEPCDVHIHPLLRLPRSCPPHHNAPTAILTPFRHNSNPAPHLRRK